MPIDTYPPQAQSTSSAVLGIGTLTADLAIGATETDGPSVTVSVSAGRTLKLTAMAQINCDGTVGHTVGRFREGATELGRWAVDQQAAASVGTYYADSCIVFPTAGTHTYKLTLQKNSGAGTVSWFSPVTVAGSGYILVEDISGGTGGPGPIQLGYAQVTANQTGITTEVDLTGLSVTVTVPAGRRLKITGVGLVRNNTAGAVNALKIMDETSAYIAYGQSLTSTANADTGVTVMGITTPTAGTHTYRLRLQPGSGTAQFTAGAGFQAFIVVEDITGTPAPGGLLPSSQTLGYAEITAAITGLPTAATALAGLSTTVAVPGGRRLRVTAVVETSASNAGFNQVMIYQDGAQIERSYIDEPSAGYVNGHCCSTVISPSAGVHTYSVYTQFGSGTGRTYAATNTPEWILVEDITGGALPVPAASVPVGQLGYSEITSIFTIGNTGTETDVTGLSVNVTVPSGRTVRVTGIVHLRSTVGTDITYMRIREDGNNRGFAYCNETASAPGACVITAVFSPTAGAHTYKITGTRNSGTGSVTVYAGVGEVSSILVEDITPTPAPANSAPSSTLGYAEITASQASITTEADITGLSVTVTVPAGRRLRITAKTLATSTVANDSLSMSIKEGGTYFEDAYITIPVASRLEGLVAQAVIAPSAGAHTYFLRMARRAGTGTCTAYADANVRAFILVEDITAVSNVKTFVIPHPADAERYLVHACIEGPEATVFYRGQGQLVNGWVQIDLPEYFEALCAEEGRSVQLTCIADDPADEWCPVLHATYPKNGKFWVGLGSGMVINDQRFWWEVKAVRKDVPPVNVEPLKTTVEVLGSGPYTYTNVEAPAN